MQVVILAGGKGIRMGEFTKSVPKPLITVAGKTLIDYKLEILPRAIDEVVLVVGYLGDQIRKRYGNNFGDRKIVYVEDRKLAGTAEALRAARDFLEEQFLVMMGDDLYCASDLEKMVKEEWALGVVSWCGNPKPSATVYLDDKGRVRGIVEAVSDTSCRLVNAGLYTLGRQFFEVPPVLIPGRTEYGLPQTIAKYFKGLVKVVTIRDWFPITNPEDLKPAEEFLKERSVSQ